MESFRDEDAEARRRAASGSGSDPGADGGDDGLDFGGPDGFDRPGLSRSYDMFRSASFNDLDDETVWRSVATVAGPGPGPGLSAGDFAGGGMHMGGAYDSSDLGYLAGDANSLSDKGGAPYGAGGGAGGAASGPGTVTNARAAPAGSAPEAGGPALPPGGYLSPFTHRYTCSDQSPAELVQLAFDAARSAGADCEVQHSQYAVDGLYYHDGDEVVFRVRVWRSADTSRGQHVFEAHRLSGDSFGFAELYRKVELQLARCGAIDGARSPARACPLAARPLPADCGAGTVTEEQRRESLSALLRMASGPCPVQAFDALRSLQRDACEKEAVRGVLADMDEAVPVLVEALRSRHRNVHRCSLATLAALAGCPSSPVRAALPDNAKCMETVRALLESRNRQVVRDALALLDALTRDDVAPVRDAIPDFQGVCSRLVRSVDPNTRTLAETLLDRA